jgi:hypothetical protein
MTNEQTTDSNLHAERPTSNFQIRITRPDDGTIYHITPQTPIETQRIPVQAIVADGVKLRMLTLLVDGQAIGDSRFRRRGDLLALAARRARSRPVVDEQADV